MVSKALLKSMKIPRMHLLAFKELFVMVKSASLVLLLRLLNYFLLDKTLFAH